MAQSVLVGIGPAELSLVPDEQSAVVVDQSAEVGLAIVAVEAAQALRIGLIDNDPSMAALGMPSRTMVAVAVSDVLPKPTALGLATVSLSPSLEMVVPAINIF